MVFKIYRHYINGHKEEAVKEVIALPGKSPYRKALLDKLRKKGDYIFNTQLKSEDERPLVCRQTLRKHKVIPRANDVPCPSCWGYFSKYSIRHQLRKCLPVNNNKVRRGGLQVECRRVQNNIHNIASDTLKYDIFPVLNDEVINTIRYNEAVIIYANYLCRKYTTPHHAAQIRSNMRTLGRLILAMKKLNPAINCLYDALGVSHVDLIIKAIDKVAGLDENSNLYTAPATALLLATELKKLCELLCMEFIKKDRLT